MGLFDKLLKENNNKANIYDKLFEIACDYDGYDIVLKEGKTEPAIYSNINEIITNGKNRMDNKYHELTKESTSEEFYEFYDEWINDLREKGFVVHLDNSITIEEFADGIGRKDIRGKAHESGNCNWRRSSRNDGGYYGSKKRFQSDTD